MPDEVQPDVQPDGRPDAAADRSHDPLDAYDVVYLLGLAFQQLLQGFLDRLGAAGYADLRPVQAFALQVLAGDGATSVELAARLGMTKQAAGQLIDYLEAQGYVERQPHPRGGRRRLVVLSRRGRQYLADARAIMRALEAEAATVAGDAPLRDLRDGLIGLIRAASPDGPPPLRPVW